MSEMPVINRIHHVILAAGDSIVAIRLGSWWLRKMLQETSPPGTVVTDDARITCSSGMTFLGLPVVLADDKHAIEPLCGEEHGGQGQWTSE